MKILSCSYTIADFPGKKAIEEAFNYLIRKVVGSHIQALYFFALYYSSLRTLIGWLEYLL